MRAIARNSSGLTSGTEYTMTTAASTAFGISAISGASSSRVASAAAAVTSSANCVRAPALRFTAVCDVPPPAGIAPNSPPPTFASPIASSSRFARGRGSSAAENARAAAMLSVKLMSAMPTAAGQSSATSASCGQTQLGSPRGTLPIVVMPALGRSSKPQIAMPAATAISGAGARGAKRSSANSRTTIPTENARVSNDVCGRCSVIDQRSLRNPALSM